ncbi:MAG: translocation/assembly module TamB domain-containing protein [Candidatus Omnitrophica bacterium]|nr:translocation/assembly module TamB domain-containing protein [Candidatus Omnitrophota bacterium]
MKKRILVAALIAGIIFFLIGLWLILTANGNRVLVRYYFTRYADKEDIDLGTGQGSLIKGLTFENLEIADVSGFPFGTRLKAQSIFIDLDSLNIFSGLTVKIDNMRLLFPESETLLIYGSFQSGELDFNIYSRGVTVYEVKNYLPDLKGLIPIDGSLVDIDLAIKGRYFEPEIAGSIMIEECVYKGFTLTESRLLIDAALKDKIRGVRLYGDVKIDGGILRNSRTEVILEEGLIKFSGLWDRPDFLIKGYSTIEATRVNIVARGPVEKPEIMLSSDPPYSEEKLMVMLATGKSWQSVEKAIEGEALSSLNLSKDFIDYFFFAGKKNKFAGKLGIHDVTLKMEKNASGFGAKKNITGRVKVGFELEKRVDDSEEETLSRKIQGEVKVTDSVSVGVEREVTREQNSNAVDELSEEVKNNDKVYLKYRRTF